MLPYQNPLLSPEDRTEDLLARMTLAEKVGQMLQLDGRQELEPLIHQRLCGSLLHILGERAREAIESAARTRLGIPLLLAEDAIHGHSFWPGATIFPTQLALAASWNPDLLQAVARVTAREVSCTGPKWTFSPVLCLTRDLRWGRVGETFGEDPYLIGVFAAAMIAGYQGPDWTAPDSILATAKHYAGYSETQGGRDASEADISPRKLRTFFLPPFEQAAKAGCMAFMTGYQSMEGLPSTVNRWLLTEVLRREWGFEGIVVTDWDNVGRLHWEQQIAADLEEAAVMAVEAGNDLIMATPGFHTAAMEAVHRGLLQEEAIDSVCRRLLRLKFRLGLFENPGKPDRARQELVIGCPEHRDLNLEAARQSVVLLQNNGILPLESSPPRRLAVVGPNADDPLAQLGDWSLGSGQMVHEKSCHPRSCTQTVLDGLRAVAPAAVAIEHLAGCSILGHDLPDLPALEDLCARSDHVIAVLGDTLGLIGEARSTATLELQGGQVPLLETIARSGKPFIVILICSKPLVLPPAALQADAILTAFNPGMRGGLALAEVLFGQVEPAGRLTVSWPRHVGQQPVFHSQVRGQHGNRYADLGQDPLFPFGHGLGYTRFAWSSFALHTPILGREGTLRASVTVTNTGDRPGTEVVQWYVTDCVTSVTWMQHELKGFTRLPDLAPGQSRRAEFSLPASALTLVDARGERVLEPGAFILRAAPTARADLGCEGKFEVV